MHTITRFEELADIVTRLRDVYVRYSEGPDADLAGPSTDYEAGVDLPGWSVTPLNPEPWWTRSPEDWIARRVCKYADLAEKAPDRRPWVLTGTVVGRGPDHEPLVVDVDPLGWIDQSVLHEAKDRYEEAFAVGQDSAGTE